MTVFHSIDFEIESTIDLQLSIKLDNEKERVIVDSSECYLYFHELDLHLQGDKDPGWLKHLFTNFISFTLELVLKSQVCKKINFLSNLLADFIQDTAANFFPDGDIGLDISLAAHPIIKANCVESHHKDLTITVQTSYAQKKLGLHPSHVTYVLLPIASWNLNLVCRRYMDPSIT
ncbi:cholesteryl ester transfer protein [Candoia aspera]|uniref:cholesteryl ester transfer protein n=1 Tax=Candoia aspera TaxID=51853 RepID=UPI002FD863EA